MKKNSKILILGSDSCIGNSLKISLKEKKYKNVFSDTDINLFDEKQTKIFFKKIKPEYIFQLYGISGSLRFNLAQTDLLYYKNYLAIESIFNALKVINFKKIIYLSSSCIYPSNLYRPHKVSDLFEGMPEKSSLSYALAKMAAMSIFSSTNSKKILNVIPSTIYGPYDNYDKKKSHVIGALISKIHNAKKNFDKNLYLYGSGRPIRDFIYSKELANILIHYMNSNSIGIVNVTDKKKILSINRLANKLKKIIGYKGKILFDNSIDGSKYKVLHSSINSRKFFFDFDLTLRKSYQWYLNNKT